MGRQIAALIAASGPVRIWDADPGMLAAARERIATETRTLPDLPRYAHHQFRLEPPADLEATLERIRPSDLADAVAGADIVIEAVREDLETKQLRIVRRAVAAGARGHLTTNSSSFPSSQIAPAVEDPGRFLNTHFFAPVWSRPMVELMGSGATRPEVMAAASASANRWGW